MSQLRVRADVSAFATLIMHLPGQSETKATTVAVTNLYHATKDVTVFEGRDLMTGERVTLTMEYTGEEE